MPRQHEQRPTLGVTQHPYGDARQKAERGKAPGKAWIIRPLIQAGFTRPHGVQRGGTFLFLSGAAVAASWRCFLRLQMVFTTAHPKGRTMASSWATVSDRAARRVSRGLSS